MEPIKSSPYHILAIREVCRQLYHDTTLLPFQLLPFAFEDPDTFTKWHLNNLSSTQRKAIVTMKCPLNFIFPRPRYDEPGMTIAPKMSFSKFTFKALERVMFTDCGKGHCGGSRVEIVWLVRRLSRNEVLVMEFS